MLKYVLNFHLLFKVLQPYKNIYTVTSTYLVGLRKKINGNIFFKSIND